MRGIGHFYEKYFTEKISGPKKSQKSTFLGHPVKLNQYLAQKTIKIFIEWYNLISLEKI